MRRTVEISRWGYEAQWSVPSLTSSRDMSRSVTLSAVSNPVNFNNRLFVEELVDNPVITYPNSISTFTASQLSTSPWQGI